MEPTKRCPMCGEEILLVAVRCKHCQADLRSLDSVGAAAPSMGSGRVGMPHFAPEPVPPPPPVPAPAPAVDSGRGPYVPPAEGDFEQRFLDFAFKTGMPINGPSIAYALKMPIDEANERLEDLAARDVLIRDVDARGVVFFQLPGRAAGMSALGSATSALSPYASPPALLYDPPSSGSLSRVPTESTALAGLLINVLFLPGLGSLVGGKTSAGIFQLLMFLLGVPLCLVVIGVPMLLGAWIWGLVTGVNMLSEAKQNAQLRGT